MAVSAERLASIDEELAGLGRSEDQIEAVLARFEDRDPVSLEGVDDELAMLAEGVSVAPAVSERPASVRPEPEPEEEEEDEAATLEAEPAARLSVDDLFDDTTPLSDEPDLSSIFGASPAAADESEYGETGLADSLEAELEGLVPPIGEEPPAEPTNIFSSNDIAAIEQDAAPAEAERPHTVPPPLPSSRPVRPPSDHPPARDPDFDALLGDDESIFRPSQHPPAEEGAFGDFELLVEEDILVVEEDEEESSIDAPAPWPAPSQPPRPLSAAPPPSQAPPASPSKAPPPGEEGEQKKGFFKKLFGSKDE